MKQARLLRDLPDIRAGAIFTTISKRQWEIENFEGEYDSNQFYYFHNENDHFSIRPIISDHSCFHIRQMEDWFEFRQIEGEWLTYKQITDLPF